MTRLGILLALILGLLPALGRAAFDVTAASAILMDADSGRVLWAKNADVARFPASTTKVLTGLLLVEKTQPTDLITAPPNIETVGQSSMHLKPGEKVSARDLLVAMMLRSANDGCYAAAVHLAGSEEAFGRMMNERAKELGCKHSNFVNPNGLNNPLHKTSAYDLALITREAMKHPEFREIVRMQKEQITRSINQEDRWMINRNKQLWKDPTTEGVKTGWTIPAGHCFVGSATRNGFRLIAVVLKSEDWQSDYQRMVTMGFAQNERKALVKADSTLRQIPVQGGTARQLDLVTPEPAVIVGPKGGVGVPAKEWRVPERLEAPVKAGQEVGQLVFKYPDGEERALPLVAASAVDRAPLVARAAGNPLVTVLLLGGLLGSYAFVRARSRKRIMSYGRFSSRRRSFRRRIY